MRVAYHNVTTPFFYAIGDYSVMFQWHKKISGQDHAAPERNYANYAAEAICRRRRILQAGAFLFTEKLIPAPENAQDLLCEEDVWYQELLQFQ